MCSYVYTYISININIQTIATETLNFWEEFRCKLNTTKTTEGKFVHWKIESAFYINNKPHSYTFQQKPMLKIKEYHRFRESLTINEPIDVVFPQFHYFADFQPVAFHYISSTNNYIPDTLSLNTQTKKTKHIERCFKVKAKKESNWNSMILPTKIIKAILQSNFTTNYRSKISPIRTQSNC